MADEIDMAQALEAKFTSAGIEASRQALQHAKLKPTGFCLNPRCCDEFEAHETNKLFCGAACAEEYETISKRKNTK